MARKAHWEQVYESRSAESVSWFQPHAHLSLALIQALEPRREAHLMDVGGGASTLVDDLVRAGYQHLSVLDIAGAALGVAQRRLGLLATGVAWLEGDVTELALPQHGIDLWHDRAVFHFLTEAADRQRYVRRLLSALRPGGHVIISAFAEDGPAQCSGLPVRRYSGSTLWAELGAPFQLLEQREELHHTPAGAQQQFIYCAFRRPLVEAEPLASS